MAGKCKGRNVHESNYTKVRVSFAKEYFVKVCWHGRVR